MKYIYGTNMESPKAAKQSPFTINYRLQIAHHPK